MGQFSKWRRHHVVGNVFYQKPSKHHRCKHSYTVTKDFCQHRTQVEKETTASVFKELSRCTKEAGKGLYAATFAARSALTLLWEKTSKELVRAAHLLT